jgi:hypothetical protein
MNYSLLLLSILLGAFYLVGCARHAPQPELPLVTIEMHSMGVSGQQQFREVLNKKDLPAEVVKWFTGGIADPGEKYFETDVGDSHLPVRRLLVAGKSSKYCIVNYEHGGFAHGYVTRLFALNGSEAKPIWTGGSGKINNLNDLKTAIESGKLQEINSIW